MLCRVSRNLHNRTEIRPDKSHSQDSEAYSDSSRGRNINDYRGMLNKPMINHINTQWMLKLRDKEYLNSSLKPSYMLADDVPGCYENITPRGMLYFELK